MAITTSARISNTTSSTIVQHHQQQQQPLHHHHHQTPESSSSLVEMEYCNPTKSPTCNACPYCSDTCNDLNCESCELKVSLLEQRDRDNYTKKKKQQQQQQQQNISSSSSSSNPLITQLSKCCSNSSGLPTYSICEVKRHNTKDSAWLVVGTTIYDVTTYVQKHPGGISSILKKSGGIVDCTMDYKFHSKQGQNIWEHYRIGKISKCPGPSNNNNSSTSSSSSTNNNDNNKKDWWMFWA